MRGACYWVIGADNQEQPPAVAIDLHEDNGELLGETHTITLTRGESKEILLRQAKLLATKYAQRHGVAMSQVWFDDDSTRYYAKE